MFLLSELILAFPLVVYAWIRARSLMARRSSRAVFSAVLAALVAAYPLAEGLSHARVTGWVRFPVLAGYLSLPLLLYFVLTVILSDLVILGLRVFRIASRDAVQRPWVRRVRLGVVLAVPVLVVAAGMMNFSHLRVQHYAVDIPGRSSELYGLRVVFASDFHLGELTADDFMPRVVEKINAQNPDIILIGGDVLEGGRRGMGAEAFAADFRGLRAKYGVFAVPGNHERHGGGSADFFKKAAMRLLEDEVVKIDSAFYLAGRKDAHARSRKSIEDLLSGTPDDLPVILLDHRPVDLERVSRSRVDMQLSGHTHAGQLFPLNLVWQRIYELNWGYLKKGHTHFFVTSGLGLWGPPVRTAGATEILVIDVTFK
jgi:predicted MPP superfamily phosphohydrolase